MTRPHSVRRPLLVLLNGAPGSGKSTLAELVAAERPLALALDIDQIKHSLSGWDRDLHTSGLQARRLAVALIRQHLADGHDVMLEIALILDEATLARRLSARRERPDRPEQAANDRFVGPEDASELVASIEEVLFQRPGAHRLDARESQESVRARISALLSAD